MQPRPPELRDVLQIARGLARLALDDAHLVARGAAGAAAAHHVAPGGRVARGGDEVAPSSVGARRREKRRVGAGGGTQAVRRGGLPHAGGQADRVEPRPAAELQRHLVAELTVEPRDAVDGQQPVTALGAPGVGDVEHRAHQAAAAELGARADDLGLADRQRHAGVRPRVREQHHRRDDRLSPGVPHEQRALGAEGRVSAFDQVAGPGAHRGLGVRRVLIAQDVGVERGERVGVGRGSASEDETVAEIAQHDSGRVGPARASVNRGPSTQRRALNDHLQRPHDL